MRGKYDGFTVYLIKTDGFSAYLISRKELTTSEESNRKMGQQPTGQGLTLSVGTIVWNFANNKTKLYSIISISEIREDNQISIKIRVLNTDQEYLVLNTSIEPVNNPKPSDNLQHSNNTNKSAMIKITNEEKMKNIWEILAFLQ